MGDRLRIFVMRPLPADSSLGATATIVQFSSAFCQPCRATRRTLRHVVEDLVTTVDGIELIEIDADDHLNVTRAWGIESTPTVVFLDARGQEVLRAGGQPRTADVLAALAQVLDANH
ncbi:MAG: thioredoxin family protein [Actinomycetota bacterium]|nr:thioredoxin family protein [Actinomycetota bacterium]